MKIYITHYAPLTTRKPHIIRELTNKGIYNFEFIETHDKENLTNGELQKFSKIRLSEISLFLKHIDVFKQAILQPDDIICVFEDDAILKDNFHEIMHNIINNPPKEWDVIFTAECCDLHIHYNPHGIIIPVFSHHPPYLYDTTGSRGTCMYIINKAACKKIIDIYENEPIINEAIDHWFNYIRKKYNNFKYFWCEPTIVDQGSTSIFGSSIR